MIEQEVIQKTLVELGFELADRGSYWQTSAIFRNGNNKTAIQIYKNSGVWRDYVNQTKFSPLERLVEVTLGKEKAKNIIENLKDNKVSDFLEPKYKQMEVDQFFSHEEIKTLLPNNFFYNKKKISDRTLSHYNCGFSMSGKMNGRFVFPIFDENKRVVGLSGRHLQWNSEFSVAKWKHIGRKANWILPINNTNKDGEYVFQESVEKTKSIMLVESIGDSLALTEQGQLNHLVLFGLDISSRQISYLLEQNLEKIYICTNNDTEGNINRGRDGAMKIFLKLTSFIDISKLEIKLPLTKDFGDMLESDISFDRWISKSNNIVKQIEFIAKRIKADIKTKGPFSKYAKKLKLLENYIEQIDVKNLFIA